MDARTLHIVTAVSNPIGWESRIRLAKQAVLGWLSEPNVHVTIVECAYGGRAHDFDELAQLNADRVSHVKVRASTLVWNKENLLNIGISRLPPDAKYIGTFDADITFRRVGWAENIIRALDIYPVIQPWDKCYDLGPNDEHMQTHVSFASIFHAGGPVVPNGQKWWKSDGGPYEYAHSGFAYAWTRDILDRLGGLFEIGAMGSGDHHMALSLVGKAAWSIPPGTNANYALAIKRWEASALAHVNGKLGFIHNTIEHWFHGKKQLRAYNSRWEMFLEHAFDPITDIKKNTHGVIEFSGNKPTLERAFDRYLRSRSEDSNSLT